MPGASEAQFPGNHNLRERLKCQPTDPTPMAAGLGVIIMAMKRSRSTDGGLICSALAGLLLVLSTWTSALPSNPSEAGMYVAVHEGEISVDLHAAQIQEVLALIGQ
jgi:hypothetical protein